MKRFLLTMAVLIATALTAWAQKKDDVVTVDGVKYRITSDNLFVNGSFDDGVAGWKATNYYTDAVASNFTLATEGGFDGGAYITTTAGGAGSATAIRQAMELEAGKKYYFAVYTSGKAPSSNNFQYNALFKMKSATEENGVLKQFSWPQGAEQTSTEWSKTEYVFTADASIPYVGVRMSWNQNSKFDGFFLGVVEPDAKDLYDASLAQSKAALENADYNNVTGQERTDLQNAVSQYDGATSGYQTAAEALSNALSAFTAAKASYDAFAVAKDIADPNLQYASADKKTAFANAQSVTATNAAAAKTAADDITTALRAYYESHALAEGVTGAVNATENIKNPDATDSNNGWTWTGNKNTPRNTESWTDSKGKKDYMYFDGGNWGAKGWTTTMEQELTLPRGKYLLTAKGRASDGVTLTLSVGAESVELPNVNASGNVFDRGWGDGSVEFLTMGEATITVKATTNGLYQWFSVGDFRLVKLRDATEEELNDAALKDLVAELVNLKNDTKVPTTNIGTEAFQYDKTKISAYQDAVKDVAETVDATIEAMKAAEKYNKTALTDMLAEMKAKAEAMAVLNAPKEGDKFHVVLTYGGWTYDNKAMTYIANGRSDAGNYNIQYKENANNNLAQAFTFTQVEGNNYKMCQTDNDGNERYITTGQPYGGNANQIRTSTNADDALVITVIPTAKEEVEGVYNILNTAANNYIGSQDAGVFTVNSHIDFFLKKAEKAVVDLKIDKEVKYATRIFPFKPTLPEGIKAYACAEFDETTLTLTEVAAPEMNVPYILYAENGANTSLEDWGKGVNLTYTKGLLTGVYEDTAAPEGTYVLQNQEDADGVAFYVVEDAVTVSANRAYLKAPATDAGVKAFRFPAEETTGINAVNALTAGKAEIFSVAGARIPSLQKGVNIIRTADGKTTKVLVK
ncbi:MAG: hypothetical protein IJ163_09245 [Bacteroidaceae bacterium]|nr:hypothetical protein [Bacteroidaceae bacterium]